MIPKGKGLPRYAADDVLNTIRGKAMVDRQTHEDVWTLLDHLQLLEHILDEDIDGDDRLGPKGWRHYAELSSRQWEKR